MEVPGFFFLHGSDPGIRTQVEEYQEIALRNWLPRAIEDPQSDAAKAMAKLADLLAEEHSDPWMKDFLKASRPEQRDAARALSEAITANKKGFYDEATEKSHDAAQRFANSGNVPGRLRAQMEEVYAEQRKLKVRKCLTGADELRGKLLAARYYWLQGQLMVEKATCANLETQLAAVEENLETARKLASEHDFSVLSLRILGIDASIEQLQHREYQSWQKSVQGIARYYRGTYPSVRLYQFYSVTEQYAERKHLLYLQRALLSQAISILEDWPSEDANPALAGALYLRLSNVYAEMGLDALAQNATTRANVLFDQVPNQPYVINYVLFAKISAADRQLRLGTAGLALSTLEPSRRLLPAVEHDFMFLDFNRALGDSYRQARRFEEAAQTYENGIVTAESALATLEDPADRLQWMRGAEQLYRGLVLNLIQQNRVQDALKVWEWSRDRSSSDERPAINLSWAALEKEIFRPLPSMPETHLIYAALADRLQIWIVKGQKIKSKSVATRPQDLESLVNEFAGECANSASDVEELKRNSLKLSAMFLQPILSELLPSESIAIELDPKLFRLPLSALMPTSETYLDDQHSFTVSPGFRIEMQLRQPGPVTRDELVLVADASPVNGAGYLPGHDQLTKAVSEVFPSSSVAQPATASWKTASRQLARSGALVFIGHGIHSSTGTALVYGNTHLTAKDFSPALLHRLDLAVLIACSSGAAGDNGLLEADSLVRPFLKAGVPHVIASRWDVDSRMSARLMEDFHRRLGRGEGVASALSLARKQVRIEKPHPYYWAAFDLDGRAN